MKTVGLISNNNATNYPTEVNQSVMWVRENNLSLNVGKTKGISIS